MYLLDDVFTMLDAACRRHSCTFKLGTVGDAYVAVGVDSAVYRSLFHGAEAPPSPRTGHFHLRPKTFFLLPLLVLSFFLSRRFCLASTPLHLAVDPIRAVFIGRPRFCFRRFGLALLFVFLCCVFFHSTHFLHFLSPATVFCFHFGHNSPACRWHPLVAESLLLLLLLMLLMLLMLMLLLGSRTGRDVRLDRADRVAGAGHPRADGDAAGAPLHRPAAGRPHRPPSR